MTLGGGGLLVQLLPPMIQWRVQERRSMTQTPETKLAKQVAEALDNHWFNPSLFADVITTDYTIYTQNQLMELIKWVIKYQAKRMKYEWEQGWSSDNLLLADTLADMINTLEQAPVLE